MLKNSYLIRLMILCDDDYFLLEEFDFISSFRFISIDWFQSFSRGFFEMFVIVLFLPASKLNWKTLENKSMSYLTNIDIEDMS